MTKVKIKKINKEEIHKQLSVNHIVVNKTTVEDIQSTEIVYALNKTVNNNIKAKMIIIKGFWCFNLYLSSDLIVILN